MTLPRLDASGRRRCLRRSEAAAVLICLLAAVPAAVPAAQGDELYTWPGQLVPAQDTRLNFYCTGSGSPAVVFDSGWEDWAPVWAADEAYLEQHRGSFGSRPIRVLSTGYHGIHERDPTHPKTVARQQYEDRVARAQAKWLALSSNARQLFATDSSEYIPFDQPDFVVDAIHQVYAERNRGR